ncbi:MAG: ABC transporter permease [Bryobacteraceae bacterium]|nr:ABC transporter permease [Bryobacteraceae bacterium]
MDNLRYAVRQLWKSPGFSLIAILTLALGAGATTVIFSVVNAWVLKPLPYRAPDELVSLFEKDIRNGQRIPVAPGNLRDYAASGVFAEIEPWGTSPYNLTGDGDAERIELAEVGAGFFPMLGVEPALGRGFAAGEDREGASRVILLAHSFWTERFEGRANVLGQTLKVDGKAYTIAGVMPREFHFPLFGRVAGFIPLEMSPEQREDRRSHWMNAIGRLRPGVAAGAAQATLETVGRRLAKGYPDSNENVGTVVRTLHDDIGDHSGNSPLLVTLGLVGCVMLIACANVANLLLARATGRRREIAVRLAVGASRGALIRQLLTETSVLFVLAGAVGLLLAQWGLPALLAMIPFENRGFLPNQGVVHLDYQVLAFALSLCLATGAMFGLWPALVTTRLDLNTALKDGGRHSQGVAGARGRRMLVAGEVALAALVLVMAVLMVRSAFARYGADLGIDPRGVLTATVDLDDARGQNAADGAALHDAVLDRLRANPRVQAAGAVQYLPFGHSGAARGFVIEGRAPEAGERLSARFSAADPGYREAIGLRLKEGRWLERRDGAGSAGVAVISEAMARRYFPRGAVGRTLLLGSERRQVTIVGVAGDTKFVSRMDAPENQIWFPYAQAPARRMTYVARTASDLSAIRDAVRAVDRDLPVSAARWMEERIHEEDAPYDILTRLITGFGLLALFLAALGLYGVIANSVASRIPEIGLRMAVGASRGQVVGLVFRDGMRMVMAGLGLGLAAGAAAAPALATLLYGVAPRDLGVYAAVGILLVLAACGAILIPARRAAGTDPLTALRYE